jgi:acetylornithine deacetylase
MKGGLAAAIEAMRALRDTDALPRGGILLTAHDLHESPWGDSRQVNGLIAEGYLADGVLLPEYLADCLPIIGRGLAILEVEVTRSGAPVHEVLGGIDAPSVIGAGAEIVLRMADLDTRLAETRHPLAGRESLFVGQIHAGEIYNQAPTSCSLSGTRRWLPGTPLADVEQQYRQLLDQVATERGVEVEGKFLPVRDAYQIDPGNPLCRAFQTAHHAVTGGELPVGAKPFVDDGNAFAALGNVPAITHGPRAKGAHTLHEEVPLDELARVALVYALTGVVFCDAER